MPTPAEPTPANDHLAVQEWVEASNQRHAAELRVLQNRVNRLIEENTRLVQQNNELSAALDLATNRVLSQEVNS